MVDEVTVTSSQSWGSRLGASLRGVLLGIALFVAAFPLLWWNEGRAVQTAKSLTEGAAAVVSVSADTFDPANEGKLVHVSGRALSADVLQDPQFTAIQIKALNLKRKVEMYQWVQKTDTRTERKVGGSEETVTTYSYSREWATGLIDSSTFHESRGHENPREMPYEAMEQSSENVSLGAFKLPANMVSSLPADTALPVPADASASEAGKTSGKAQRAHSQREKTPRPENGVWYIGYDPQTPDVGDVRISYSYTPEGEVSVIARQSDASFAPYQTKAGDALSMIKSGKHDAQSMFTAAQEANTMLTWGLRVLGFMLMFVGLRMLLGPLDVLADVLPMLGGIMRIGTGLVAGLVAGICSLLVIALAWVFYRPLLGIVLLAAAGGLGYQIWRMLKANKAKTAQATPPMPAAAA